MPGGFGTRVYYTEKDINDALKRYNKKGVALMTKQKNNSKYLGHDYTNKSTDSARLIQSVRKLFSSGGKFTAKELNSLAGTNDARSLSRPSSQRRLANKRLSFI